MSFSLLSVVWWWFWEFILTLLIDYRTILSSLYSGIRRRPAWEGGVRLQIIRGEESILLTMKLTIFSRLVLGYLLIVFLVLGVSVYMIFQLVQFETITHSILEVDHRIEDLEKKLTDSLLSQMGFEKKYVVIKDEALYVQFLLAREDFKKYLEEVLIIAGGSPLRDLLTGLKASFQEYQALIEEEVGYIRAQHPYLPSEYRAEKEKIVDQMLEKLKTLVLQSRQNALEKIVKLEEEGVQARQVTMMMATVSLAAVIAVSFLITRGITYPISLLIGKTREIARGSFDNPLRLASPPEMKELSEAVNTMCDRLTAIDRMKSDFFSALSHDLRTPLTSIKEGTSLLLDGVGGQVTEKQRKLLKIIALESNRLIELVNSSLDLSKMEAGMMVFNYTQVSITPLIQKAVGEIEPLAMAKKIQLQVENHENLPVVKMDRERILQVLRNFLGNAVKFTFEGGIVKISACPEEGNLKVTVSDTGPGIPEENLAIIFDKFQQGSPGAPKHTKGTGLGLAIVKQIITAHGGKVWAESKPGQGSSFIFVLPA
jgi:two-component system sensor histidine kinase GlrK